MGVVVLSACQSIFEFEPPSEEGVDRCSNGFDDDGDGEIDCEDPDCFGSCPEESFLHCQNGVDDDGDGATDLEESICWQYTSWLVGQRDETRCRSYVGSELVLSEGNDEAWIWTPGSGEGTAEPLPWANDPFDGQSRVIELGGEPDCARGGLVTISCDALVAEAPLTGGPCWSLEAEVHLASTVGAELALVLAEELETPPLRTIDAAILVLTRVDENRVAMRLLMDGREHLGVETTTDEVWMRLEIETRADSDSCQSNAYGEIGVRMSPAGADPGIERRLTMENSNIRLLERKGTGPLRVALQAASPASSWVRSVRATRSSYDTCGFRIPQLPATQAEQVEPLSAARGGGTVCVVGATVDRERVEPLFVPETHQGSPPRRLAGPRRFAAWSVPDRGLDSFDGSEPVRLSRATALEDRSVRAAALSHRAGVGFEGVFLVADDPSRGGAYLIGTSVDCVDWVFRGLGTTDELSEPRLQPLEYDAPSRIVTLVEPGGGYGFRQTDPTCNRPDFEVGPDVVPHIKPTRSECVVYPRASLWSTTVRAGTHLDRFRPEGTLPALGVFQLDCACTLPPGAIPEGQPNELLPVEVHQMFELGGFRAFLGTRPPGSLELAVDTRVEEPAPGRLGTNDAVVRDPSVLLPTGASGTFDAAAVGSARLLLLEGDGAGWSALLFYQGYESRDYDEATGLVRFRGGRLGAVPVHIGRGRSTGTE